MTTTLFLRQDRPVTSTAPLLASIAMPYRPAAVSPARMWLSKTLADWGVTGDQHDNSVLLLSEIFSNAILHNRIAPGFVAEIHAFLTSGWLRVTVSDPDRLAPGPDLADDEHGRGLLLVNELADRWGTERTATGKVTFYEIFTGGAL